MSDHVPPSGERSLHRPFAAQLRAEATKLGSVRRWAIALVAFVALTVGFGVLSAAGSGSDANEHPSFVVGPDGKAVVDGLYFVHGPLHGDGVVVVRVSSQQPSHPWARAGLTMRESTDSGSRYASIFATPGHGIRFDHDFGASSAGSGSAAPRWLRLTREGSMITGEESGDGVVWEPVGRAELGDGAQPLEVGMFVASPPRLKVTRTAGGTGVDEIATQGTAVFDDVAVQPPAATDVGAWQGIDISRSSGSPASAAKDQAGQPEVGVTREGDRFTVSGSGEIGPAEPPDDGVQASLFGTLFGVMALVSVAVLFITSEYKHGLIRVTFAACPRRRRAFAAKAVVLAATAFAIGLAASVLAYFVGRPILARHGITPPAYAPTSLWQATVLRAVVGNAVLVTALALLALSLGALWRRSGAPIALMFALGVLPLFAAALVPAAADWILRLTPAGGLAIQRAKPPTKLLAEPWSQLNPWLGLGVACTYAVVALAAATWVIGRRDA